MQKSTIGFASLFTSLVVLLLFTLPVGATPTNTCDAFASGSIPDLSSLNITFDCASESTVYFGACDSGSVPNDDLFNITYNGSVVSSNQYNGSLEFVNIGQATAMVGLNQATLNSLSVTNFPPATFSYAISPSRDAVVNYLAGFCGADFGGEPPSISGECTRQVPVFTMDTAPSDGTLTFNILFGEKNRWEGITLKTWQVEEGQRLNNDLVSAPGPNWARLWWQPSGEETWYLLTSQYWQGGGTSDSEYGISCSGGVPSYHTAFENAIPEYNLPNFRH